MSIRIPSLLLVFVFASALPAMPLGSIPDQVKVGDIIRLSDGVGNTNGGEFYATLYNNQKDGYRFSTFCLERSEHITFYYTQFLVSGISDRAYNGGVAGSVAPGGDPLSDETKYLYYHFRKGDLATIVDGLSALDFTYDTSASYDSLQYAFWTLENELTSTADPLANELIRIAGLQAKSDLTALQSVAVLNLTWAQDYGTTFKIGDVAQDQLVIIPTPVPEAGTILLGLGIVIPAIHRLRRRS